MKRICSLLIALMVLCLPVTSLAANDVDLVTRAEFVKEIMTKADIDTAEVSTSSFTDVVDPENISYIETAYNMGIISGYGEEFKPNANITKEQAISVIVKAFGEKVGLKKITDTDIKDTLTFADSSSVSNWAKPIITYALKTGLLETDGNTLSPKVYLNEQETISLVENAKTVYEDLFTKDGMSASEMLLLSNENILEYDTYTQEGSMSMNMKMIAEGMPQEEIDKDPELQSFLNEGMDMNIDILVQMQNPDKAYIKEVIKSNSEDLGIEEQNIEIFMDSSSMYTKATGSDKWIMQDISPLMNELQSVSPNSEPYQMTQLTEEQLELFTEFAKFEEDTVIDGKEYYVISMFIDKESYKKYFTEIVGKTVDSIAQIQSENPEVKADPNFDPELYKQMMLQMVNEMEIEIGYKYYVDKETKNYEKMWMSQDMYMPMDNILQTISQLDPEEEIPDVSLEMLSHTEGEFNIYGFNEEVTFPGITEDDILDVNELQNELQMQE